MKKLIGILCLVFIMVSCFPQVTNRNIEIRKANPILYLSGTNGIINFYNSDITLSQSSDLLTLAGGNFSVGTNSIYGTGTLGLTGSRFSKGWLVDLEITNIPSINGTPMPISNWNTAYGWGNWAGHTQAESTITFTDITTNNATTGLHGYLPKLGGGTTNYLRADGTWTEPPGGSGMVYPGAGIALSTGSAWTTSITNNSSAWNTAVQPSANTNITGTIGITGTTKTAGYFYAGTVAPTNTNRLNFDGHLYGTQLYDGGTRVSISGHTHAESVITFTDITTNNATTVLHGYLPKLGGGTTNYLRADGTWAAPPGGMVYPAAGVPVSTGSAWTTSLLSSPAELNYSQGLSGNIQGQFNNYVNLEDVFLPKYLTINAQTGTTYTLVLTDAAKFITRSNSSANTTTVPPNSSVAFPIGTQITVTSIGTGQATLVQGSGVTISSAGGAKKLRVQYSTGTLIKIATDIWLLIGDIAV